MIYYNGHKINKMYNGTDLVTKMNKTVGGSRLPDGYTEVEYIQNTEIAYIDTGFKPNQDTRIQYKTQCVTSTQYAVQVGCGAWDKANAMRQNYESNYNGTLHIKWGAATGWDIASNIYGDYNEHTYDWNKNQFYRDGTLIKSTTYTNFQCTDNLALFHCIEAGISFTKDTAFKGKMFYCKIYDNGTLVRDLVPCKNPNNVAGMYDLVGNTFYGSANNRYSFIAGNPVTPAEDKAIFQYVTDYEEPIDYSKEYLTFVAEANNVSFSLAGGVNGNTFQYSTDGGQNWNNVSIGQTTSSINTGDKMLFKATSLSVGKETGIGTIRPSGNASVEGNVMSLIYGDNFSGQTTISNNFQLRKLFSGATHITSAENMVIPISTFKKQCCSQMFNDCSNLVTPPKVVGTATARFDGDYCISDMFANCSSLVTAPELPMTTLGKQCYWYMMQGCTSLTEAPLLPAATINTESYRGMFYGCTNLSNVTCLATGGISTNNCYEWLKDVSATGTFTKAANTSWSRGQNAIPSNWTVIEE